MIIFEEGVSVNGIKPETLAAMVIVDRVFESFGFALTVTSCCDGKHSRGSLHYVGYAFDGRKWYGPEKKEYPDLLKIIKMIQDVLTDEYDVVLEKTHFHIEFQPKIGLNLDK